MEDFSLRFESCRVHLYITLKLIYLLDERIKIDEYSRNYEILAYLLIASNCDIAHV